MENFLDETLQVQINNLTLFPHVQIALRWNLLGFPIYLVWRTLIHHFIILIPSKFQTFIADLTYVMYILASI